MTNHPRWIKASVRVLLLVLLVSSIPASATLKKHSFDFDQKFPQALDLYAYKNPKKLDVFAKIKWYQIKANYRKCAEISETKLSNTSLGVWIAYTHLRCLESLAGRKSSWKAGRIIDSFKKMLEQRKILIASPFQGHREKLINVYLQVMQLSLELARNRFDSLVGDYSDLVDYMTESQRARYYEIMGELAWLRQQNEIAKANFVRSYLFKPKSAVLARIKSLKASHLVKAGKYSKQYQETDEENKLWGKFAKASRKGQSSKVAQYGVELLNNFPGSQRVDKVKKDINSVYKRLLYRRGPRFESAKNDFEKTLEGAPPEFIMHWAQEAYDRGYQKSSYRLANAAAEKWAGTPHGAKAMIVAARSAFYLVKRSEARKLLTDMIEKYSGSKETAEAQYLLGLLYFREAEYKKVVSLYEPYLQNKGSDKWELQVRYWLWRSLKKVGSKRAAVIAESILKVFPLTYYGLRVRMEEKGSLSDLLAKDIKTAKSHQWWTKSHDQRWNRIQKLIKNGWVDEAETEIDYLPNPQTAEAFLVRAKVWQGAMRQNRAIQDFAPSVDLDLRYLSPKYMKEAFPQKFSSSVNKASKEFGLNTAIIWAIMRQESAFRPRAVSPSYAYGLMQLLKPTARESAKWLRVRKFNASSDIYDPDTNVRFGSHFLSRMLRKYKNVAPLAVASYNVGPGNLDRWLSHRDDLKDWQKIGADPGDDIWMDELPWAETSFYVKAVMRNFLLYQVLHGGLDKLADPPWKEVKLK